MASGPNLFARLHKWAVRQDENFLTESLAVVLEHLLILAPEVGTWMIGRLTDGFMNVPPEDAGSINIRTQVEAGQGRPDLEIGTPRQLVWVEVKAESGLRAGQLAGYRVLLTATGMEANRLILLTRYAESYGPSDERPDGEVKWLEVADWLEGVLPALATSGEVVLFLIKQFLDFLRARGMNLTQVGKYMPDGLRDWMSLLNMLFEAAAACKVSARIASGRDNQGINLDGVKYWIGVNYRDSEKLWFGTRCRIDPEAAARLGVGEVTEETGVPGRYRWWWGVELNSEDVHFFSRHKVSQMQWLESHLRKGLTLARSIETPDQPPIPEESEET